MTAFSVAYESAGAYLGETIDAPNACAALDIAEAGLSYADYADGDAYSLRSAIETIICSTATHTYSRVVVIDPPEPTGVDPDGHEWDSEDVRGHGGGVIVSTGCSRCGWERVVDTWADDGQGGHIRTIAYSLGYPPESLAHWGRAVNEC